MENKKDRRPLLHIAYTCGKKDKSGGALFGDTIIRLGEGVTLDGIREWLKNEIEKDYEKDTWNIPTILDISPMEESLALQLAPTLKKVESNEKEGE